MKSKNFKIIAGPCSAESREQLLATTQQLAAGGIQVMRAGLWKPRTMPGGFEGPGEEGLPWLKEVKESTGIRVATEVATADHVQKSIAAGIDILWIGARTVSNPFAMQAVAEALNGFDGEVMVKNPISPDIELWCGALQRLKNCGIKKLTAIHRGFSSIVTTEYRNEPLWSIPIELKRRYPEIPILCDPSHIGGKRRLIAPLCQTAIDLGFDGLMIEVHNCPSCALTDAQQQLTPEDFFKVIDGLDFKAHNGEKSEALTEYRSQIDDIDAQLLALLAKRMEISQQIGEIKKQHSMSVLQPKRYSQMLEQRILSAQSLGLSPDFVEKLMQEIHEESVKKQLLH